MRIAAIILTKNESLHLDRCLTNVKLLTDEIFVVDSGSTDSTENIARSHQAKFLFNSWINYSIQFNWALSYVNRNSNADWILRIDADELMDGHLINSIKTKLNAVPENVDGFVVKRRMSFRGKIIKHGGVFPSRVLRLVRRGSAECEQRWMDEHLVVDGKTLELDGELLDDNLNSLTWWVDKHNHYASREAVDIILMKYTENSAQNSVSNFGWRAKVKRFLKVYLYLSLPGGLRAILYFFYRYVFCLGFLDGSRGFSFHFFQGLWYRALVDEKVSEVESLMKKSNLNHIQAVKAAFNIDL